MKIWCEIVCSRCGRYLCGEFKHTKTTQRLNMTAKQDGWKFKDGLNMCPDCFERYMKKRKVEQEYILEERRDE